MEGLICVDASVLIEYFRKKKKSETLFAKLSLTYTGFVVPAAAHSEIYYRSTPLQNAYRNNLFSDFLILPFTAYISLVAVEITKQLKANRTIIEFKDLTIAASALNHNLSLATTNEKHFKNILGLDLITSSSFNP